MFPLGQVVATPRALSALRVADSTVVSLLVRHQRGDWGDVEPCDIGDNDEAMMNGGRIMSVYQLPTREVIWVITEDDRGKTTLMLPDEY